MTDGQAGVSFVVPVLNGRSSLQSAIDGIIAQRDGRPFEIVVVDDGSTDGSLELLNEWHAAGTLKLIAGPGRGAAAAINAGIRETAQPIICQVDQDVILPTGWLAPLLAALEDPDVAAAQGQYVTRAGAGFWARVMGLDLEQRYSRIRGSDVDHVCTGNTAYRARALYDVDLLDEHFGYGYDNDLSYRLTGRGHRLVFCREARSTHCWRESFHAYLRQQFGVGYGRLDLIRRHPGRISGDDVSGLMMMVHAPAMLMALSLLAASPIVHMLGGPSLRLAAGSLTIIGLLAIERTAAGIAAWRANADATALAFPVAHFARDCAWAAAIVAWAARRCVRERPRPAHSMLRPRLTAAIGSRNGPSAPLRPGSLLVIVPAFNEGSSLRRVVADLRRTIEGKDILIVNDGSTDGTEALLPDLGVPWLTMSQRVGVGGAVRAGIRYALQHRYEYVVRVDGDGQHRACDIARLLEPVASGRADAAIGSRFLARASGSGIRRLSQSALAACLSALTGQKVTDPTSGFWLFGPRALRLLARHHPGGYAEPELILLLSRNGLRGVEVPIRMRPRLSGRTSLTASRAALALARTALALAIVPFRRIVEGQPGD